MARGRVTKEAIVDEARRAIALRGVDGITYQALADALGVTKQAIIYWYPSKAELARDLCLPVIHGESEATILAVAAARDASDAIERFLRALVSFHLADIARFRMVYIASQVAPHAWILPPGTAGLDPIHSATSAMYGSLEAQLRSDRRFARPDEARRTAVAVHMAGIGLLTMVALADAVDDPLAHRTDTLLDALVETATGRLFPAPAQA